MVKDPNGSIIHLDQAETDVQGEFTFRYNLRTDVSGNGEYTVTVGGANILLPKSASFLFTYEETSEITPTIAVFDKNIENQVEIPVDMSLKGNTLLAVRQGDISLVPGSDYRIDGTRITLTNNYLNTLPVGTAQLTLSFNAGLDAVLTLNIVDTTPSNDATLKNISISNGILVPTFSPERTIHLGLVDNKKDSWMLTVSANDMKYKSITVNGTPVQSGAADYPLSFKKAGLYTIVVTAEDGVTTRTYTLAALKVSKIWKPNMQIEKMLAKVLDRYSSDVNEMSRDEGWVSELEAFIQGR
ncbi:Endoglucanase Z precursor [compost metagenome]